MLHDFDSVFGVLERCLQRDDTDPHIIASIAVLLAHLETDITLRTLIHRRYCESCLPAPHTLEDDLLSAGILACTWPAFRQPLILQLLQHRRPRAVRSDLPLQRR